MITSFLSFGTFRTIVNPVLASMPTYDYECTCGNCFEDTETIADRNKKHKCPECGKMARRVQSLVNFNTVFPGSTRALHLADDLTRETEIAQAEGFRSKDEIQTAIGLAEERSKQMGYGGRQLVGPVKSPFKGDPYQMDKNEQETQMKLRTKVVEAQLQGNTEKAKKAARESMEFASHAKAKADKVKREFKPDRSPEDLKKAVKDAQSRRSAALR